MVRIVGTAIFTTLLASAPFIVFVSAWAINTAGLVTIFLAHIPSLLSVGTAIGIGTYMLRGSVHHALIGATYGWIAGTVLGLFSLWSITSPILLEIRHEIFNIIFIPQLFIGGFLGVLPAIIELLRFRQQIH